MGSTDRGSVLCRAPPPSCTMQGRQLWLRPRTRGGMEKSAQPVGAENRRAKEPEGPLATARGAQPWGGLQSRPPPASLALHLSTWSQPRSPCGAGHLQHRRGLARGQGNTDGRDRALEPRELAVQCGRPRQDRLSPKLPVAVDTGTAGTGAQTAPRQPLGARRPPWDSSGPQTEGSQLGAGHV